MKAKGDHLDRVHPDLKVLEAIRCMGEGLVLVIEGQKSLGCLWPLLMQSSLPA
jgi:hypothetical protein